MGPKSKLKVKKKNKKMIFMEIKHEIIRKHEQGVRICDLATEYGRNASTISTILKQKDAIKKVPPSKGITIMSRLRSDLHDEMECLLLKWIKEKELAGDSVTGSIISEKAIAIFNDLKRDAAEEGGEPSQGTGDEFKASRGWFENFKKRTGIFSLLRVSMPEMAMISDSDQLPEQMVKTQHFAPELPVKCEPDQLEVQIVKTQHFTEAMEVQSAVAAATANIIPQSPIESYDPGPEQSLQNSKMRGCTDKDMALSFSASSRPVVVFKKTYVDPEHTDGMMKSLASLWRKRRLCDAKICSGDKNVTLHRLVLFAASPHLMEKNITDGADLEVNLPAGISEDGLKIFVSFLYDGVLNLNEHLYKDVERISNLLKVDKVQKHCREFSASLNEHRQMTSSPLMSIPRRRDNLPKSQKSSNRQTVVLTLSDDSNPAESSLGHPSTHQQPQEHTLTLSQSQYEDLQNNIDERIQALNEHHAFMTSHHDRYPPVTQNSGISLQTATNPTMASESGIKTEPIEILDDDITDYPPTTPPTQDNIKHSKRILNSSKSFASESPGSETMRRSSQNLPSSTVTRTYLPTSKCESGLDMNEMDGIATSGASSTTSPYPVSLVASSGETFPLYTLSSNQS